MSYINQCWLEVPSPEEYGIEKEQFLKMNIMAEQALASGSPSNNPKILLIQILFLCTKIYWNSFKTDCFSIEVPTDI